MDDSWDAEDAMTTRMMLGVPALLLLAAAPAVSQTPELGVRPIDATVSPGRVDAIAGPASAPYRGQGAAMELWRPEIPPDASRSKVLLHAVAQRASSPKTGAAVGATLGGLGGVVLGFMANAACDAAECPPIGVSMGIGLVGGAIGGGIVGYAIGTLFQAPSSAKGRNVDGPRKSIYPSDALATATGPTTNPDRSR